MQGEVLEPADPGFDEARSLWNMRFGRRPDLVARCIASEDVAAAVDFARSNGMQLSVKAGGHSYAAKTVADSGLLIDLSAMKAIEIDLEEDVATIEPGVTCGELDAATQKHGLATTTPTVSSVSVVGAALGGGSGYLGRKYGLTVDNLLSAHVVTADGREIDVGPDREEDLFWALRGGAGNFGVVTSMQLRLHEVGPQVLAGQIIYPFDNAAELFRAYRDFMATAPNEFQCYAFCFRIPPIEVFPKSTHGQPVIDFVVYHEDPEAVDVVKPLRDLGETILDFVGPAPYVEVQQGFDANLPKGHRYLSKAHDLDELSDEAIDTMVEYVPKMVGAFTAAYFDPLGGAIAQIDATETPFAGRSADFGFHCLAGWIDAEEDEEVMAWASEFHEAMAAHATGGVYVNLIAEDEDERVPAAYGPNYQRLVELKGRWDPSNLFQGNYNIPPA